MAGQHGMFTHNQATNMHIMRNASGCVAGYEYHTKSPSLLGNIWKTREIQEELLPVTEATECTCKPYPHHVT